MSNAETNPVLKGLYAGLPAPALKRMGEVCGPEEEVF